MILTQKQHADSVILFNVDSLQTIHFLFQVSPSVLNIEECSNNEYTFSITPTIPVGTLFADHLEIGFFLPPKILLQNTKCNVEIRDKQTVTVRVIAQCTNGIKDATKIDKVVIPEIRNTHSGFWNRDMHFPAVWVIPFFVILILKRKFAVSLVIRAAFLTYNVLRDHMVAQARNMSIGEHRRCCVTFEI